MDKHVHVSYCPLRVFTGFTCQLQYPLIGTGFTSMTREAFSETTVAEV